MKIVKSNGKKNVFDVEDVDNEIREVVTMIDGMNKSGFDNCCVIDVKINLISFKIANMIDDMEFNVEDSFLSFPIIRIPSSILSKIDHSLTNDIFITYNRTTINEDNYFKTFSIL